MSKSIILSLFITRLLVSCSVTENEITANQYKESALLQARDIFGVFDCQTPKFSEGDTLEGIPDRHVHTVFYFEGIKNDSLNIRYRICAWHPYNNQIETDTGNFKLKCLVFESPSLLETEQLLDSFLMKNLGRTGWGTIRQDSILENFRSRNNRNVRFFMTNNRIDSKLSDEEKEDAKNNQFFKTSIKLKELDLSFFKNRKSIWIGESQAARAKGYLRIDTPIFNSNNTICYLHADFVCNRNDECGGSISAIYQKREGRWQQVYVSVMES